MADLSDKDSVRLLISDIGGESGTDFLYTDNEVENFLRLNGGSVRRAAAQALRSIAGNESQVSKRIKFLELSTDGPSVSKELRALAEDFISEAVLEEEEDEGEVEIAHMSGDWDTWSDI